MTETQRTAMQQALEALEQLQGGCTDSDDGTVEAITVWCPELISTIRAALAEPVQFDPAEAMRLADDYASAQSQLDGEHSMARKYYVESRDEARVKLAEYLGIKEEK